jgi:hypothetical protein
MAKRAAQIAAHLVDHVLPHVPYRQSMAFSLYTIFHKRQYDIRGVAFNQPLGNLMQIEKIWEEALSEFMGIFRHHDQMWRQRRRVFDSKILVTIQRNLI